MQQPSNRPLGKSRSTEAISDTDLEKRPQGNNLLRHRSVLRIQGGANGCGRDVWDVLAQAAEEIESIYENRRGVTFRGNHGGPPGNANNCNVCGRANETDDSIVGPIFDSFNSSGHDQSRAFRPHPALASTPQPDQYGNPRPYRNYSATVTYSDTDMPVCQMCGAVGGPRLRRSDTALSGGRSGNVNQTYNISSTPRNSTGSPCEPRGNILPSFRRWMAPALPALPPPSPPRPVQSQSPDASYRINRRTPRSRPPGTSPPLDQSYCAANQGFMVLPPSSPGPGPSCGPSANATFMLHDHDKSQSFAPHPALVSTPEGHTSCHFYDPMTYSGLDGPNGPRDRYDSQSQGGGAAVGQTFQTGDGSGGRNLPCVNATQSVSNRSRSGSPRSPSAGAPCGTFAQQPGGSGNTPPCANVNATCDPNVTAPCEPCGPRPRLRLPVIPSPEVTHQTPLPDSFCPVPPLASTPKLNERGELPTFRNFTGYLPLTYSAEGTPEPSAHGETCSNVFATSDDRDDYDDTNYDRSCSYGRSYQSYAPSSDYTRESSFSTRSMTPAFPNASFPGANREGVRRRADRDAMCNQTMRCPQPNRRAFDVHRTESECTDTGDFDQSGEQYGSENQTYDDPNCTYNMDASSRGSDRSLSGVARADATRSMSASDFSPASQAPGSPCSPCSPSPPRDQPQRHVYRPCNAPPARQRRQWFPPCN